MNKNTQDTLKTLAHIPAQIACANDYEALAPRFIAEDRFAYISGGSGHDETLANNSRVFNEYAISPRLFGDMSNATTEFKLLGQSFTHPFFLAPVAYQTLVHPQGEMATAYAAESTDTCMLASTLSSFTMEKIVEQAKPKRWFQLYSQTLQKDTDVLIQRAVDAGYEGIVLTVDAAIQAPSLRAIRSGFQFPKNISAVNLKGFDVQMNAKSGSNNSHVFQSYMQNALSQETLQHVIEQSPIPVIVKGVLHPDDAKQCQQLGAAGLVVSNHGGRTLDGAPATLAVLPEIRDAVGHKFPVLFDGGIRSGNDAFKAIALGADAVLIGRLQVYALAIAGALGVAHMIKLLREELEMAMAMTGCKTIADVKSSTLFKY